MVYYKVTELFCILSFQRLIELVLNNLSQAYSYHSGLNKSVISHDTPGLSMIMKEWHTTKLSNMTLNNNSIAEIKEFVSINHDRFSYSVSVQVLRTTRGKKSKKKCVA